MSLIFKSLLVVSLFAVACSGCAANNNWRQFYLAAGNKSVQFSARAEVQVRVVSLQQVSEGGANSRKYLDDRRLAPEDMTPEDGKVMRQIQLDALRVREDPQSVARLGNSSFTCPVAGRPDDQALISFAKSIGADFVVMATEYAGERKGYAAAPVMSSTTANATANAWGSGGWAQASASGYSNTMSFVPVPVTYQQWTNVAIFWRRVTPAERAMLDALYPRQK